MPEEHPLHRTTVGKLLWMRPLGPDIQYATKELTLVQDTTEAAHASTKVLTWDEEVQATSTSYLTARTRGYNHTSLQ
eukprot:6406996-Amphidinium_carterae.2